MVEKRLRKSLPNIFANILTRKLFGGFFKFLPELVVVVFGATGETNNGHRRWQFSSGGKIIQRRNKFPMGQVSGGAKNHNPARLRHRAGAQTFAQRIRLFRALCHVERSRNIPRWNDKLTYRDSFQPSHKAAA